MFFAFNCNGKGCEKVRKSILAVCIVIIVMSAVILPVAAAPKKKIELDDIYDLVTALQQWTTTAGDQLSSILAKLTTLQTDVTSMKTTISDRMTTVDGSIAGVATKVDNAAQKIGAIQTDTGTIKAGISDTQSSLDDIQDQISQINVNREPTAYEWYITIMYDNYDRDSDYAWVYIVNYDYFVSQKTDDVTVEFIETAANKEIRRCSGTQTVQRDAFFLCALPDSGALDLLVKVTTHSRAAVPMITTARGGIKLWSGDFAVFPIYS